MAVIDQNRWNIKPSVNSDEFIAVSIIDRNRGDIKPYVTTSDEFIAMSGAGQNRWGIEPYATTSDEFLAMSGVGQNRRDVNPCVTNSDELLAMSVVDQNRREINPYVTTSDEFIAMPVADPNRGGFKPSVPTFDELLAMVNVDQNSHTPNEFLDMSVVDENRPDMEPPVTTSDELLAIVMVDDQNRQDNKPYVPSSDEFLDMSVVDQNRADIMPSVTSSERPPSYHEDQKPSTSGTHGLDRWDHLVFRYLEKSLPGFRFVPSDAILISHYLRRKIANQPLPRTLIKDVNLYLHHPKDLAENHKRHDPLVDEWYYFTPRDRKYPNGSRPKRAASNGYWKATGADKPIKVKDEIVGHKQALVFYEGKPPKGDKTNWIMHEFKVAEKRQRNSKQDMRLDDWVLCRIYKKTDKPPTKKKEEEAIDVIDCDTSDPVEDISGDNHHHQAMDNNGDHTSPINYDPFGIEDDLQANLQPYLREDTSLLDPNSLPYFSPSKNYFPGSFNNGEPLNHIFGSNSVDQKQFGVDKYDNDDLDFSNADSFMNFDDDGNDN